jgi:hypothetical protein
MYEFLRNKEKQHQKVRVTKGAAYEFANTKHAIIL